MKLTAKSRNALPSSDFAVPGRKFPIEDASHARNALARVADKSSKEKAEVREKVAEKFPDIGSGKNEPRSVMKSKGGVPRGEHHQANHRAPNSHAEFETLGKPVKGDEY